MTRPVFCLALALLVPVALAQTPPPASAPVVALPASSGSSAAAVPRRDDAASHLVFEREFAANRVMKHGVQLLIRSTHESRAIKVWLDRWHMGQPTADRSRTVLEPGAAADPLGCSRTPDGPQEWRIVKAHFVDELPAAAVPVAPPASR